MQPRVTIILPFHNAEHNLSDAIESMLCQTFEQFEIILIDKCSNDRSLSIANEFVEKDGRVSIIDEYRGSAADMYNIAIKEALGEFIAIMDSEDISFPNRLERQVTYLDNHSDVGVVSTQVSHTPVSDNPDLRDNFAQYVSWSNRIITHEDFWVNQFIESPIIHSTAMFRKELVDLYGGYRAGDFPIDFELWLRWISNGVKMYKVPEILYDWTELPERIARVEELYVDQEVFEMKSQYFVDWLKENNKFYPEVAVWGAGKKSRQRFFILHELGVQAKFYIDLRANPDRKVIQYQHTPPAGRNFIISYVANRGARERLRMFLVELGYIEGKDFICIA